MSGNELVASRWCAVAVAAPGCLLTVVSVIALILTALDRHPMWPHQPLNLAEAAAVRDEAEVARLIEDGSDPNARYPVRPGLLFDVEMRLMPLEAAVISRDSQMVTGLLRFGAAMDAPLWTSLRCIAGSRDVGAVLDRNRPAGVVLQCDDIAAPRDRR